jgi:hypothetical protein
LRFLEYAPDEIHHLDQEIRHYLRGANTALGTTILVGALAISINGISRDIALAVLPLLLTSTAIYNINSAAEAAAMAEQRDRLCARANRALGESVFLTRIVADVRRGSPGTTASNCLTAALILGAVVAGLISSYQHGGWWLLLQLGVTILCAFTLIVSYSDIPVARMRVNSMLDEKLGNIDRPETAPSPDDKGVAKLLAALTTRKKTARNQP